MNKWSLAACFAIVAVLVCFRFGNLGQWHTKPLKVTEWDAFGYYIYLPSLFIYHDCTSLHWLDSIDATYKVTGGNGWQAMKADNGNYVFKYLGGVAIMEMPLFFIGHAAAKMLHFRQDGFSPPYQFALAFGIIVYCFLSCLLLRKVLLKFFNDGTVAITLCMLCLATNFIQYAAVDSGQSHAYLFMLYVLIVWVTVMWHQQPRLHWALAMGLLVGLASASRPTEAIMLFIPLFWGTQTKDDARAKKLLLKRNKSHIVFAVLGGFLGVLPQLIYWKITSGSFLFDVGSKWDFLKPHFNVLFGWEKGWFIYTPITLFFVIGMFFMKQFPFRKSVLWFCFLNIYIIIAWHDWRYGGSFSTRALVQSYPLFAFPFAALTDKILKIKWAKLPSLILFVFLLFLNFFQTAQYDTTVLHFNDMNFNYYRRIFLNPHPSPEVMSLLDVPDFLGNEKDYAATEFVSKKAVQQITFEGNSFCSLVDTVFNCGSGDNWLKTEAAIQSSCCLWTGKIQYLVTGANIHDSGAVRLYNALSEPEKVNHYAFFYHLPTKLATVHLQMRIISDNKFDGTLRQFCVKMMRRK
jgi:hypothetical protein